MFRLLFAAVVAFLTCPLAVGQTPKPTNPPPSGESQAVLEELGLTARPGLPTTLPEEYRPDLVTAGDVRRDPKRYPVRAAVLDAVTALQKSHELPMTDTLLAKDLNPRTKQAIVARQEEVAKVAMALRAALDTAEAAAGRRGTETSKRWQAHYDYTRALVKQRLALVEEYNLMLGRVRRDELPELDPKAGQTGWRIAPTDKVSSARDVRELADDARRELSMVAKSHPKTTWAVLAEMDQETKPGLRWEPAVIEVPKSKPKKK
jgi:hypothetical protein